MEKTGYLGPEGSYSHLAAMTFCPNGEPTAYGSFQLAVKGLLNGECGAVALPIENSLNGSVTQNMDLLQYTDGIVAVKECTVKIDHRLAVVKGTDSSSISRIYSHQQALAQCGKFLFEKFPYAELIATTSTAASLKMLKSPYDACIVGAHMDGGCVAGGAEVVLSPENIADNKNNFTNFLLVKRGSPQDIGCSEKIFFSATCLHRTGALLALLSVIRDGGLNMTKIYSRPVKDKAGEYRFFIEIDGDIGDVNVKDVLQKLEKTATAFKILGAY